MYINLAKMMRIPGIILGIVLIGFGVYGYGWASPTINQQIASALIAIFGLQFMWFVCWITGKR